MSRETEAHPLDMAQRFDVRLMVGHQHRDSHAGIDQELGILAQRWSASRRRLTVSASIVRPVGGMTSLPCISMSLWPVTGSMRIAAP